MNILVVDDDPHMGRLLLRVLGRDGHQVTFVESGSQALQAAIGKEFDLLLCDLVLPDLEGIEIIRALKAQSPRLPVVVISGLDSAEWKKPCENAGAARFLSKPFDIEELRREIHFVEQARLHLKMVLIDTDQIHSNRLSKALQSLGCKIQTFRSSTEAISFIGDRDDIGLVIADKDNTGVSELIRWLKPRKIPVFAMYGSLADHEEDSLMRSGAAFMLKKPVNIDALLTQTGFLLG